MSRARSRAAAFICACALVGSIVAIPAPPRRSDNKDSASMAQEKTIVIRRVPNAYLYPFSLWPMPKYPLKEDTTVEYIYNGKTFKKVEVERNKR